MGLEDAGVRGKQSSLKIAKVSCEGRNGVSERKRRKREERRDEGGGEGERAGGNAVGIFYFFGRYFGVDILGNALI